MKLLFLLGLLLPVLAVAQSTETPLTPLQRRIQSGVVEGVRQDGVYAFRGIPYAAPPVGALRWQPPQPVAKWAGVRPAQEFGPRPMQLPVFPDMVFRSKEISEDCLYLNVWTFGNTQMKRPKPGTPPKLLPVLVYFHGGGFVAGSSDEPRYDGAALAMRGVVVVTVNYRLGVFGLLAHPELTGEAASHASGNYGLLDQVAALRWVQANIAAFHGDPARVTIGGESAGSISVSALLVSPLARGLFARALGESGSVLTHSVPQPLAESEQRGAAFAARVGAKSLAELRALPAQLLLDSAGKAGVPRFGFTLDRHVFPQLPAATYAAGEQARVPLLVGWNSEESGADGLMGKEPITVASYTRKVRELYGAQADEALRLYPAATDAQARQAATDLASDRFMGYSTWKWAELHARTSGQPVYRYLYAWPRPPLKTAPANTPRGTGAGHSVEIEYALGNLATNQVFAWVGSPGTELEFAL